MCLLPGGLFTWAVGALLAFLIARAIVKKRKRSRQKHEERGLGALEGWILEQVERTVGKRVSVAADVLGRSLRGEPEPDAVAAIETAVKSVEVEFARFAHEDDLEVAVHVRFEDGTVDSARKRAPFAEAPTGVRAELERTGAARAYRPWDFPWSRPR
jgi:hypothetical protein